MHSPCFFKEYLMSNQDIVDEVVKALTSSSKILSANELSVIRRFIYNIDNIHVFSPQEISTMKEMMDEYMNDKTFREVMKFFVEEYRREEDRVAIKNMTNTYKIFSGIAKVFVWIRNVIVILTPIVATWILFKEAIVKALIGG